VRGGGWRLACRARSISANPFPGPGLGVRILGEVGPIRRRLLRRATRSSSRRVPASGWYERTSQAFDGVFLPVRRSGVMGRRVSPPTNGWFANCVRADAGVMTAIGAPMPHELLGRVGDRAGSSNEVRGINRVV